MAVSYASHITLADIYMMRDHWRAAIRKLEREMRVDTYEDVYRVYPHGEKASIIFDSLDDIDAWALAVSRLTK